MLVGKPIYKGTRIDVELMIGYLLNVWTVDQIVEQDPGVTPEDVFACLRNSRDRFRAEVVVPPPR